MFCFHIQLFLKMGHSPNEDKMLACQIPFRWSQGQPFAPSAVDSKGCTEGQKQKGCLELRQCDGSQCCL